MEDPFGGDCFSIFEDGSGQDGAKGTSKRKVDDEALPTGAKSKEK